MFNRLLLVSLAVGLASCVPPPPPPPPAPVAYAPPLPGRPNLGELLASDEQRIQEGAQLGQLTTPEYNELQGRHANIERDRQAALTYNGGVIPPAQYQQLLGRQEALSRTIFAYRHNGATPTAH